MDEEKLKGMIEIDVAESPRDAIEAALWGLYLICCHLKNIEQHLDNISYQSTEIRKGGR